MKRALFFVLCLTASPTAQQPSKELVYPIIPNVGGVVPLPDAAELPRKGAKVVFDITADAKPADVNKGLERVARLLNLYGSAGLKASDVKIALVVHGEATKSVLTVLPHSKMLAHERGSVPIYAGQPAERIIRQEHSRSIISERRHGFSHHPIHG
jgi:hypothetical protein